MATINQRKEAYIHLADTNNIDLHDVELTWKTHKEADEAFASLNEAIEGAKKAENVKPEKESDMDLSAMTKAQMMAKYEEIRTADPELAEAYPALKKSITKLDAEGELRKIMEDAEVDGDEGTPSGSGDGAAADSGKGSKKSGKAAKKQKAEEVVDPDEDKVYLTEKQYALLQHFPKSGKIKVGKLLEAMELPENKIGTLKLQLAGKYGLANKGMLIQDDGEAVIKGIVQMTPAGIAMAKAPFEASPVKPKVKKEKAPFVAPHTQEEIDGAKKKKAKKMVKANEEALAEYEKKGTRSKSENPSDYSGGVPEGRHQARNKGDKMSVGLVCRDLFEQKVGDPGTLPESLKMTQPEFVTLAGTFGINPGMARRQWGRCVKNDFPYELEAQSVEPPKKDKKKKKGKKGKKEA